MVSIVYVNPGKESCQDGLDTFTCPLAPAPTTAVIVLSDVTLNEKAGIPPKVTEVAPVRFIPVIAIVVPVVPPDGEKELILYINGTGTV